MILGQNDKKYILLRLAVRNGYCTIFTMSSPILHVSLQLGKPEQKIARVSLRVNQHPTSHMYKITATEYDTYSLHIWLRIPPIFCRTQRRLGASEPKHRYTCNQCHFRNQYHTTHSLSNWILSVSAHGMREHALAHVACKWQLSPDDK